MAGLSVADALEQGGGRKNVDAMMQASTDISWYMCVEYL